MIVEWILLAVFVKWLYDHHGPICISEEEMQKVKAKHKELR